MAAEAIRRLFTVAEYYRMGRAGILTEDDRVELIEGEIIQMPPIGSPHASCVNRINRLFSHAIGDAAVVSVQNPLRLSDRSEPVPDLLLLRPRADLYATHHPTADDVLLLVEVADTSLAYDEGVKLPLYAREGVPEVWIADLPHRIARAHREPTTTGYRVTLTLGPGDRSLPAGVPRPGSRRRRYPGLRSPAREASRHEPTVPVPPWPAGGRSAHSPASRCPGSVVPESHCIRAMRESSGQRPS